MGLMTTSEDGIPQTKTHVRNETGKGSYFLSKFSLYETKARFYLLGTDKTRKSWKVLKIDRCQTNELEIFEDPTVYSQHEYDDLLKRLDASNQSAGGLKFVTKAYGIVGFIKFLEPYYMILVTKRQLLGNISGHSVYGIGESRMIALSHPSFQTNVASCQAEIRYKKLFNSIDLTKDFFFSYTYRTMWSLQKNVLNTETDKIPFDDMFVWNSFLTNEFRQQVQNSEWILQLIHGFFQQRKLLDIGPVTCMATLIARRSRHFAGTRYLKRGVNEKGRVANDVETEQIVHEEICGEIGQICSVVQHRGSIPLFWSQDTSVLSPRPDIKLQKDDSNYKATRIHFENLAARYGTPIIVLNLVKTTEKKPREMILCREFAQAVAYINKSLPKQRHIKFVQWDLHKFANSAPKDALEVLGTITADALNRIGFYYSDNLKNRNLNRNGCLFDTSNTSGEDNNGNEQSHNNSRQKHKLQSGVLRSNCIDCLDRTNVAQFCFGLAALRQQLHTLGLRDDEEITLDSNLGIMLVEMYENMGDVLALQYGGSTAHNTVLSNRQGKWKAATQSLELLRAIKRHYSNAYTDGLKQDAINLFLGHYRPELGKPPLWQLDSDNHLQIRRSDYNLLGDCKSTIKRSLSAGGMLEGASLVLSPTLDFHLNNPTLDPFDEDDIKGEAAEENVPPTLEAISTSIKTGAIFTRRSCLIERNQDFRGSIFFIPNTIEEESNLPEKKPTECSSLFEEDCSQPCSKPEEEFPTQQPSVQEYTDAFIKWIDGYHFLVS